MREVRKGSPELRFELCEDGGICQDIVEGLAEGPRGRFDSGAEDELCLFGESEVRPLALRKTLVSENVVKDGRILGQFLAARYVLLDERYLCSQILREPSVADLSERTPLHFPFAS